MWNLQPLYLYTLYFHPGQQEPTVNKIEYRSKFRNKNFPQMQIQSSGKLVEWCKCMANNNTEITNPLKLMHESLLALDVRERFFLIFELTLAEGFTCLCCQGGIAL